MDLSNMDDLVVGCGFAGAIVAERLAKSGRRVAVLERRDHIAGNMFDAPDEKGILVHRYGPHIFRTDDDEVIDYLSQFTDWRPYQHRVLASVDGVLVPVPFNLQSLRRLMPQQRAEVLQTKIRQVFHDRQSIPVLQLCAHPDPDLSSLGHFVFEKIFKNYTLKQWGMRPDELDFEATTRRVPVRLDEDDRYFQHKFQGIPLEGYTALFRRLLHSPNIQICLNVDATQVIRLDSTTREILVSGKPFQGRLIWTGAVDELFGHRFGDLPWRALRFEFEDLPQETFQPVAVVNYPNEMAFTRITEFKHLTGQIDRQWTAIAREFSMAFDRKSARETGAEPCYPILCEKSSACLRLYEDEAAKFSNLHLLGRLGEYRYYDMNGIIQSALKLAKRLVNAPTTVEI